ncbi:MAG: ABC transporter substrate-binding protein [Rhodocyclaceae bacterium]
MPAPLLLTHPQLRLAALLLAPLLLACTPEPPSQATPTGTARAEADAVRASVEVDVCGEAVRFDVPPRRAITHDVNITELFLALGLSDRLVGYSGVHAAKAIAPEYRPLLVRLPLLSDKTLNLEAILAAEADFVFAGWNYGFTAGGVTPEALARFGIQSYVLTESCIRIGARAGVALEDTFSDLLALGRIFGIEAHAQALVAGQRAELDAIRRAVAGATPRPRVFVYDSGEAIPYTAGRFAMPHAMIEAAGGDNIFADIPSSWSPANWEDVIARDPELIVIIDYDQPDADGKIAFLLSKPELADLAAIRERRFVVLSYAEATPGPRNVARTRSLAQALHPQRFAPPPAGQP